MMGGVIVELHGYLFAFSGVDAARADKPKLVILIQHELGLHAHHPDAVLPLAPSYNTLNHCVHLFGQPVVQAANFRPALVRVVVGPSCKALHSVAATVLVAGKLGRDIVTEEELMKIISCEQRGRKVSPLP